MLYFLFSIFYFLDISYVLKNNTSTVYRLLSTYVHLSLSPALRYRMQDTTFGFLYYVSTTIFLYPVDGEMKRKKNNAVLNISAQGPGGDRNEYSVSIVLLFCDISCA